MNIPEKVIISGMEYEVIMTDKPLFCGNNRAYGHIDFENRKITIDNTLRDEQGHMQTLIHEIIHGIVYDRDISFSQDDEETIVDQLAKGLYQVLKDNTELFTGNEENNHITVVIPEVTRNVDVDAIIEAIKEKLKQEIDKTL